MHGSDHSHNCAADADVGNTRFVDWVVTLVLLIAIGLGVCFIVVQQRALWREVQVAHRERAAHPDPEAIRKMLRSLAIVAGVYAAIGLSFYLGWRTGGISGGALATVAVTVFGVLVAAGYAIKTAWVSRK